MKMFKLTGFTGGDYKYTCECVSAIAECDKQLEEKRQFALLVTCENTDSGEKVQHVVFGYEPPVKIQEFIDMAEEVSAWEPLEEFHKIKFFKEVEE